MAATKKKAAPKRKHEAEKLSTLGVTFCRNFKQHRVRLALTQQEAAKKASISVAYASLFEREEREPSLPMVVKIAAAFGVAPVDMLRAV